MKRFTNDVERTGSKKIPQRKYYDNDLVQLDDNKTTPIESMCNRKPEKKSKSHTSVPA